MKVNKDMCKIAQQWAQHLASINKLEHSRSKYKDQSLGENLAFKFASNKEGYNGLFISYIYIFREQDDGSYRRLSQPNCALAAAIKC